MQDMVIERMFIKQDEGVRVDSSCPCALFLLNDLELDEFRASLKGEALRPLFFHTPAKIFAKRSDVWNLVIVFDKHVGKIRYTVTPLSEL